MSTIIQEINQADFAIDKIIKHIEVGEQVVLTKNGNTIARVVPEMAEEKEEKARLDALVARLQKSVATKIQAGMPQMDAARSLDFLYDEYGLPV